MSAARAVAAAMLAELAILVLARPAPRARPQAHADAVDALLDARRLADASTVKRIDEALLRIPRPPAQVPPPASR